MRRIDLTSGRVDVVPVPCGSRWEDGCPPCADKARRLRMAQCREGWHIDTEPVPTPAEPTERQKRVTEGWLTPARRAGDFAQALMDLGAGLCTPKRPSCLMCPLQGDCAAYARGLESTLPARAARPAMLSSTRGS